MSDKFYITTPIYYVNDVPHIGHAYTTIVADVLARYHRLRFGSPQVFFLTGLDEHGQKVQQAAAKAGVEPQLHCDRLAPQFVNLWRRLNISNDDFIRTTEPRHTKVVQQALQQLYDKGEIYQASYTGWYCTFDERFWTAKDVLNGLCPDCQRPVEQLSETNYFFRMSKYQDWLDEYIKTHDDFIRPRSRHNEVLGFLQKPLEDLSISRPKSRLTWGIELPFDANYVTYVWFDALVNYISAAGYLTDEAAFSKWWPADVHLIGKDILTTHCVYWSTMLKAMQLEIPRTIFAHGWWTVNGEKMSKSRGNVVDPYSIVDEFGVDQFRYFLLREIPFGQDGDFSREALLTRINSDLANDLGNLLNRTLTMLERYAEGRVPEPEPTATQDQDKALQETCTVLPSLVHTYLQNFEFNRALEAIWGVVQLGNQYIDKCAPWTLAKNSSDEARLRAVLYNTAETLRFLCLMLYPFVPHAAEEMKQQLGLLLNFSKPLLATDIAWGGSVPGTTIAKGRPLFPRIDSSTVGAMRVSQQPGPQSSQAPTVPPPVPPLVAASVDEQISIDDFKKVVLRVATILTAERVPKSTKLLKLQVDLGTDQRQIVAGIGTKYAPEDLIGKRIVIVANMKPAKLMGLESQGMVLAAGDQELTALLTTAEDVPPGSKVK